MNEPIKHDIISGFVKSCIDSQDNSFSIVSPKFIYNDAKKRLKVLTIIEKELNDCDEFMISVAFITDSGIAPLINTFEELRRKKIKGKILTSDYLFFCEPKAIRRLLSFENIEVKIYKTEFENTGFHSKGYIFRKDDVNTYIIGSSNLTINAITKNKEWNTKIVSLSGGAYSLDVEEEFNKNWENATNAADYIDIYQKLYDENKKYQSYLAVDKNEAKLLKPNVMQVEFLKNISSLIESYESKAILVSATGTGKTYAAAFAVEEVKPQKVLFLVHREQIAFQAKESFKKVISSKKSFGSLSSTKKDLDADYLFSTMQTMSKENIYMNFDQRHFDFIIIDEAHRVGASSYKKIVEYFKPKFLLGMTASPERTDNFNVFDFFGNNIAYEIRLQEAIESDILCPFHYFGITDFYGNDEKLDLSDFKHLVSNERVEYIIKNIQLYGYSGNKVKGLMFCSSLQEANELSNELNKRGFKTISLAGSNSQDDRLRSVNKLINGELDYILTVDIFNEGVDIPEINQVVMLRPTESPIVFVQQLGRGLRKHNSKEYVVIIDFIGNYQNNYMIPLALSGDRSYNKDVVRRYVSEGNRVISGASTIHFDEISKRKIYESIDSANFSDVKLLKEAYFNLKYKIARIPNLKDFIKYGEMDPQRIFDSKFGSYHAFLKKYDDDYKTSFSELEEEYIVFISKRIANGKRINEVIFLDCLITNYYLDKSVFLKLLSSQYSFKFNDNSFDNLVNIMTSNFATGTGSKALNNCNFIEIENCDVTKFNISKNFRELLKNDDFKHHILELLDYTREVYNRRYSNKYSDTQFVLYEKYSYDDVCRLLDWEKSEVPLNIGGYKFDKKTKTLPIFVNYDKHEVSDTINYEDRFINNARIKCISKSGRTIKSDDIVNIYNYLERGIDLHLFVRKNKQDKGSKEFYYLGKVFPIGNPKEFIMKNTNKTAVEIVYKLDHTVREDIFEYITEG